MSDADIENEIVAKRLTASRAPQADIAENVASVHYFTAGDGVIGNAESPMDTSEETFGTLDLLTFCVLVLRNGLTVTGESACASPENFNAEIGRKIALEKANSRVCPPDGLRAEAETQRRRCGMSATETRATRFAPGDRVRKVGGSYQAIGTIKAAWLADDATARYVFRFDNPAGMLHIFSDANLELKSD